MKVTGSTGEIPNSMLVTMCETLNAAAEHEPKDLGAISPERHADANFLRALACGVRHYAVNADQRERQTEQSHRAAELRAQPQQEKSVRSFDHVLHRHHVEDG